MSVRAPRGCRANSGLAAALALLLTGCGPRAEESAREDSHDPAEGASPASEQSDGAPLVESAAELGLDFVHFNGMTGELYFAEVFGSGGGFVDYDGDGDLDVILVQGTLLDPERREAEAIFPPSGPPGDRLFRNDLETDDAGAPRPRFVDVTAEAGIGFVGYGMGVAAGDIDNDGDLDLYVTRLGRNHLWRNEGDGTFSDATAAAAVDDPRWSVPAVFFDYDGDGNLDLYVGNYVDFNLGTHKVCATAGGASDYCSPRAFRPESDRLFRGRGDGTFEDVSATSGIGGAPANTLGALGADLDGDGLLDLYVANDWMANFLWRNLGDGRFEDVALLAGVAFNADGVAEASMGVDAADFDGDGDLDLFMTHLSQETNTLYRNDGEGRFLDRSTASGLGMSSWASTGFGTAFFDLEADGDLDVLVANGAIRKIEALVRERSPYPLAQRNQLFVNVGGGRFEDRSAAGGAALSTLEVSRGAAFGDVDNDGDTDVLITNNSGPARLLLNRAADGRPWLGLRLLDRHGRDALGASVELVLGDDRVLRRRVRTDGSYLSTHDPRLLFGLDGAGAAVEIRVRWPDGEEERFDPPPLRSYSTLRQGEGPREAVE